MSPKARLSVELSEKREKLNELLQADPSTLSTEQRSELPALTTRLQEIEVELRGAIVAEEAAAVRMVGSPEERQVQDLLRRADLSNIYQAALSHGHTSGVEKELQAHFGLSDNQLPLDALILEQRAVTVAPTNTGQMQSTIIPYVFPMSVGAFLNIDTPRVSAGDAVYPVLTSKATVGGPHKDSTDVSETTGSFDAEILQPERLQASFFYKRTDAARLAGMGESLRENLNMALEDAADREIVIGAQGLLTGTNLANHAAGGVTAYADYRSNLAYGRVDGRYAGDVSMMRLVMGGGTYAHASGVYRGAQGDVSALDSLMMRVGGLRVSNHVPVVSNAHKQNVIVRRGARRDMIQAQWSGVTIIPDEVTRAGTGEIKITALMMVSTKILRSDGFYKQETQHAA